MLWIKYAMKYIKKIHKLKFLLYKDFLTNIIIHIFLIFLSMSNRFLSVLILASFIWLGVAAYLYFFVYHVVVVTIQNNVSDYTVILESKNTLEKQTVTCPEPLCVIPHVPPFEYTLWIEKNGYNSQIFTKHITTSTTLDIALQKTVHFLRCWKYRVQTWSDNFETSTQVAWKLWIRVFSSEK